MSASLTRRNVIVSSLAGSAVGAALIGSSKKAEALTASGTLITDPPPTGEKITIERRGAIMLLGINRPEIQNRVDPETFYALSKAYYAYDKDPALRAAVLFGHGDNFSRGIDVGAFSETKKKVKPTVFASEEIDPLGKHQLLSKPLVVVAHGDTWNMGHELFLVADIRIASADTRFGQDENTHGRFPGGGSTVRFPREAGWGNAMRYMLTGDHWGAEEAHRMGLVQEIAPDAKSALEVGISIATKIAGCGPLGIRTTLVSARTAQDPSESAAYANLDVQYGSLYNTEDFREGRAAEAEGRPPIYHGR